MYEPTDRSAQIQRRSLVVMALGTTALFIWMIWDFLLALLMAAILSGMFYPLYRRIARRLGYRRGWAAVFTVSGVLFLVIAPIVTFLVMVADQVIELERLAATELIRAGYLDEAMAVLDRLLPRVGVRPPGDDRSALRALLRYRALVAVRGTGFRERPESEIAPARLRRIDVLTSISPELSLSSFMQGTALNVQSMWYALRAGEPRRVVIALTALAAQMGIPGARTERRAQNLVRKAQALAVRLQSPWATGRTVMAEGATTRP